MVTTLGVSSVLLLFALIVLLFRSAERSAKLSEMTQELNDANNKTKKLQSQLQGRSDKLSK